jgi:alkylation response protein AidB-like acyl-CoA dehydrogenase
MDLDLSPEDRKFRDELRAWLAKNAPGGVRRGPRAQEASAAGAIERQREWQRRLKAAGYVGIGWPKQYGGRDASITQQTILAEEMTRRGAPPPIGYLGIQMVGPTIIQWGTEEQKRFFLPRILSGEDLWCQGYSEPGSGSDLASLKTSAVREGDTLVVNGQKIWTSNAHVADWIFALVRTDPEAPKHGGISYALIEMKTPGITVRPLVQMTKDASFNEVFFDNVRVPVANVLGGLNNGWAVANTTLVHERHMLGNPTHTQNLLEGVLRIARKTRRAGRPAIEHPAVRERLARLKIEVEAMRFYAYRNLTATLQGKKPGVEPSITKLRTTWLNHRLAEAALDLLGPFGPLYRGSRHLEDDGFWPYEFMFSLGMIIGGGTSQIQKNIIAQRGLGLPRGN